MRKETSHFKCKPGEYFRNRRLLRTSRDYREWREFCVKHEGNDGDAYYQFGYETFGAVLLKFCEWLIEEVDKEQIEQIVFFSRDGHIIKKAFELLPESTKYNVKYAYVSRRSLRVPLLWKYDAPTLEAIHPTRYISIQDLFESIGLEADKYKDVIKSQGFDLESVVKDEEIESNIKLLNLLQIIWDDVIDNSKKEFEAASLYVEQLGLEENVAVVDIGWRGSMQHYLDGLLKEMGRNIKLRGYYITLSSSMIRGQEMHGYLLSVDDKSKGCDIHRGYVGLLETMFLKTEGSAQKYERDDGKLSPVLYPYEYMKDGKLTREAKSVRSIQNGALKFVRDYIKEGKHILDGHGSVFVFSNLHEVGTKPKTCDLKMFEDFRFYNGSISYLAKAKPIYSYVANPTKMIKDFYGARWRIGFMKSLFKIRFPYDYVFNVINRVM